METLLVALADRMDSLEKEILELKCAATGECKPLETYKDHGVRTAVLSYLDKVQENE